MSVTAESAAEIPLLVSRAAVGDYARLARQVEALAGGFHGQVMYWSIFCNEPWAGLSSKGPWHAYLDGYLESDLATFRAVCGAIPKRAEPAAAWKTPHSLVPLLALVGGADPQDPVGNLTGLAKAMPASRIVVVPGLGRAIGQYGCLGNLVSRFIDRGGGLDTSCVRSITPPAFALG